MSQYIPEKKRLKPDEILIATKDAARRKQGDFIKIAYITRVASTFDYLVGYDFGEKDFSECRQSKLLSESRYATNEEKVLFIKGKRNING